MAELTPKQKRFCDEYLIDLNATQAAIRAGYSEKTAKQIATENLSKPYLQEYIAERMASKEKSLIADQDEVLEFLTAVLRGTEKEEVVLPSGLMMHKKTDTKDRLKAAELLGKRYGIYTDKIQADVVIPVFGGEEDLED